MLLGVELPEVAAFSRRDLGLPEDRLLFLFFFDFTSYLAVYAVRLKCTSEVLRGLPEGWGTLDTRDYDKYPVNTDYPQSVPITGTARVGATNPYGRTKLHIEEILGDVAASEPGWRAFLLRYFNPVGAHPSGRIGEEPKDIPNNLMPFVMQVAVGRRDELVIFGDDYPTPDGTCVRDYIHVGHLASGHLAALEAIDRIEGAVPVNLGTGVGSSVLDAVSATEAVIGRPIPHRIGPRRPGDVAATWADATLARDLLGWQASRTLDDMCADHWRWQQANPRGYEV